jgi:RecA-family ATPase
MKPENFVTITPFVAPKAEPDIDDDPWFQNPPCEEPPDMDEPPPMWEDASTVDEIPKLKVINPQDWKERSRAERKWIVPNVIPDETVTILFGDGGIGKSMIALQLAAARSVAGPMTDWLGFLPEPGRTLMLSAEDDEDEMHRRLDDSRIHYGAGWNEYKDIRLVDLVGEDSILGELMKGRIQPTPMYHAMDAYVGEFRPGLVILDVLAEMFAGDENNRPQASQFIGLLKRLTKKHKCAILLLAHPSRAGMNTGTGDSGSTAWNGAVRSRLYFSRPKASDGSEPDKNLRILAVKKANYGPGDIAVTVEWRAGVFVLSQGQKPGGLDKMAREAKAEQIFVDLLAQFESEERDVSPNRGPSFAPTEFAKHPDADGITKKNLELAMSRLLKGQRIRIETFGPPSRRYKRLRLVQGSGSDD